MYVKSVYGILIAPRFVNPLAAAYQCIGDYNEGDALINNLLSSEKTRSSDEDSADDDKSCAKDSVSYSLLVKSSAASGEWSNAVELLKQMTEAGIYPVNRDLNSWKEVSSRKSRFSSWKKRRNVWIMHRSGKY
jgi:pentatricopeptide repeat protein